MLLHPLHRAIRGILGNITPCYPNVTKLLFQLKRLQTGFRPPMIVSFASHTCIWG
jgi:hypothetical protein